MLIVCIGEQKVNVTYLLVYNGKIAQTKRI